MRITGIMLVPAPAAWTYLFLLQLTSAQIGLFRSNVHFDSILPLHFDVYLSTFLKTDLISCAMTCVSERLCEGFLFNSNTTECGLLRCSLFGLAVYPGQDGWRCFNIINGKRRKRML